MYTTEAEASERSRESMELARSETRKRRAACTWSGSERTFEGEQDRIHAGVVTQGKEGDGVDAAALGKGAGRERPVLGARNGPGMDEDPVGPRHRVAGGPVGYKHGMRDGMGPQDSPGD